MSPDSRRAKFVEKQTQFFARFWFFVFVCFFFGAALLLSGLHPRAVQTATTDVPAIITYQGKLFEGGSVVSTTKAMAFSIYDASTGGNILYTAAGTLGATSTVNVTPTSGVFSIELGGSGTNSLDPEILQTNDALYLQIVIDGEALNPRKRLTSAPFAFNAQYLMGVAATSTASSSQYIPISNEDGYFNFSRVGINSSTPGVSLSASGSAYFALNANDRVTIDGSTINNTPAAAGGVLEVNYDPTVNSTAGVVANINVDSALANAVGGFFANVSGLPAGLGAGNQINAFMANLTGDGDDTDVNYNAFKAFAFSDNGGTSDARAFNGGTGYDHLLWGESGDIRFDLYSPTIETNGGSITVDGDQGLLLNTNNNASVTVGTGRTSITGSLGVSSTVEIAGNLSASSTVSLATTTIDGNLTVSGNGTSSTFSSGLETDTFAVTGSASSTFANGIVLNGGCFLYNGSCLSQAIELWEAGTNGTFEDDAAVIVGADALFAYASGGVGDLRVADELEVIGTSYFGGAVQSSSTLLVDGTSTLATTTVTRDLTVDTDTLVVDSINDRVGVNTSTPERSFAVSGAALFDLAATSDQFYIDGSTSTPGIFDGALHVEYGGLGAASAAVVANVNIVDGGATSAALGYLANITSPPGGSNDADALRTAFGARLIGDGDDTDGKYTAFSAFDFTRNGGTSESRIIDGGLDWDYLIWSRAGNIYFDNYNATIESDQTITIDGNQGLVLETRDVGTITASTSRFWVNGGLATSSTLDVDGNATLATTTVTGNFGINTSTPGRAFALNGDALFSGDTFFELGATDQVYIDASSTANNPPATEGVLHVEYSAATNQTAGITSEVQVNDKDATLLGGFYADVKGETATGHSVDNDISGYLASLTGDNGDNGVLYNVLRAFEFQSNGGTSTSTVVRSGNSFDHVIFAESGNIWFDNYNAEILTDGGSLTLDSNQRLNLNTTNNAGITAGTGFFDITGSLGVTSTIEAGGDITSGGVFLASAGSSANPAFVFSSDPDTGMYRFANNAIGLSAGGTPFLIGSNTGFGAPNGSATSPSIRFYNDINTGLFTPASSSDILGFTTGGSEAGRFLSTGDLWLRNSLLVTSTLVVDGTSTLATTTIDGNVAVSGNGTSSTFSGGLETDTFAVTGSNTSTFANGIALSAGCFLYNGSCLSQANNLWESGTNGTFEDSDAVIVGADALFTYASGGVGDLRVADELEVIGTSYFGGAVQSSSTLLVDGTSDLATTTINATGTGALSVARDDGSNETFRVDTSNKLAILPDSALRLYNGGDESADFEALQTYWSGNTAIIRTVFGSGSPAQRSLSLRGYNTNNIGFSNIQLNGAAPFVQFSASQSTATGNIFEIGNFQSSASGGTVNFVEVGPTVNQTGSAGWRALMINPGFVQSGSGVSDLIWAGRASSFRFSVDDSGLLSLSSDGSATTTYTHNGTDAVFDNSTGDFVFIDGIQASSTLEVTGNTTLGDTLYVDAANNRVGVNSSTPGFSFSASGTSYFALNANDQVYIDGTSINNTPAPAKGVLHVDYGATADSTGAIGADVTIEGASTNAVGGFFSQVTGNTAGLSSGNLINGFMANIIGDDNDTNVTYAAYTAFPFTGNGGTSDSRALNVGTGWDYLLYGESGDIIFNNYDATIDSDSGSLTLESQTGLNLNTTNNANVTVGTGRTTITGSLGVTSTLDVDDGTLYVDAANNRVGVNSSSPVSSFAVSGTSTFDGLAHVTGLSTNPALLGSVSPSNFDDPITMDIAGNYVYALGGNDRFHIFDITNPDNPKAIGVIADNRLGRGVSVRGNHAYVGDSANGGLSVVDIQDPYRPNIVGNVTTSTLDSVSEIEVSGNYAYVAGGNPDGAGTGNGFFTIVDISDRENPSVVASVSSSLFSTNLDDIDISGDYAYVVSSGDDRLVIIDISDPSNPAITGSVSDATILDGVRGIEVKGVYAYTVNANRSSVAAIDISSSTAPSIAHEFRDTTNFLNLRDIAVSGDYAYIVGFTVSNGFHIVDISSSTNMSLLSNISSSAFLNGASSVDVSGNYAYVLAGGSSDALTVIDVSGARISNADIGSAKASRLQVLGTALFDQELDVRGGLSVGSSGLLLSGAFGMSVSSTASDLIFSVQNVGDKIFSILGNGNVGIGTSTPNAAFSINSNATTEETNVFEIYSDVASDDDLVFRVSATGTVYADGAYNSTGADYAEYFYTLDTDLKPGETVCVDIANENAVRRCLYPADGNVMGIVSSQPSIVGNSTQEKQQSPNHVVVGMLGQVPAKVSDENGPVRVGDSLTSASVPGYAMRANAGDPTVGVALQRLESGTGTIQVLISRKNKSLTVETVEDQITDRIAAMEIEEEVEILVSSAISQLDLDDEISIIVDQKILETDIPGMIDVRLDDLNVGGIVDEAIANIDIVDMITSNVSPIRDILGIPGLIETTVSSTALQDQPIMTDLLGKAESTDIALAELTLQDEDILGNIGTLEERILLLEGMQGAVGEEIQGEWAPYLTVGELTVQESLVVLGDLRVERHSVFSGDTVGQAKILAGDNAVKVTFDQPYEYQPIITLTLRGESALATSTELKYTVVDESTKGFTIKLNTAQEEDILFNWHAFGAEAAKIFVSDNTVEDIQIVLEEDPEPEPAEPVPAEPTDTASTTEETSADTTDEESTQADSEDTSADTESSSDDSSTDTTDTSSDDASDSGSTDTSSTDTSTTDTSSGDTSTDSSSTDDDGGTSDTTGDDDGTDSASTDTSTTDTSSTDTSSDTTDSGSTDSTSTDTSTTDTSSTDTSTSDTSPTDTSSTDTSTTDSGGTDTSSGTDGGSSSTDTSGSTDSGSSDTSSGGDTGGTSSGSDGSSTSSGGDSGGTSSGGDSGSTSSGDGGGSTSGTE